MDFSIIDEDVMRMFVLFMTRDTVKAFRQTCKIAQGVVSSTRVDGIPVYELRIRNLALVRDVLPKKPSDTAPSIRLETSDNGVIFRSARAQSFLLNYAKKLSTVHIDGLRDSAGPEPPFLGRFFTQEVPNLSVLALRSIPKSWKKVWSALARGWLRKAPKLIDIWLGELPRHAVCCLSAERLRIDIREAVCWRLHRIYEQFPNVRRLDYGIKANNTVSGDEIDIRLLPTEAVQYLERLSHAIFRPYNALSQAYFRRMLHTVVFVSADYYFHRTPLELFSFRAWMASIDPPVIVCLYEKGQPRSPWWKLEFWAGAHRRLGYDFDLRAVVGNPLTPMAEFAHTIVELDIGMEAFFGVVRAACQSFPALKLLRLRCSEVHVTPSTQTEIKVSSHTCIEIAGWLGCRKFHREYVLAVAHCVKNTATLKLRNVEVEPRDKDLLELVFHAQRRL